MKNKRLIYVFTGAAVLLGLALMVYYNALWGNFVSDDGFQILDNPWIKDPSHLAGIFTHSLSGFTDYRFQQATYRPLMYVAFTAEYALFGLHPASWHAVNILLHGINSVLVFLVCGALLRFFGTRGERGRGADWLCAFTAGALFVSHPSASEPVSWISALPEVAYTFCVLLAFYLHLRARGAEEAQGAGTGHRRTSILLVAGPLLFLTGLLFKETAVVLPVLVLVFDFLARRALRKKALALYAGYGAAFVVYMALRVNALGGLMPSSNINAYLGRGGLVLNAFAGFYKAMVFLFWPIHSYPFQVFTPLGSPLEPAALVSFLVTVVFAAIVIVLLFRKASPVVLLAITVMVLPVLPALYTPVITRFDFAPRYVYLSTAGYALILVIGARWFVTRWLGLRGPLSVAAALGFTWVLIILCAFSSAGRTQYWHDNMSLAKAALQGSSENYYAQYQIGVAEQARGRYYEAASRYREAIRLMETKYVHDKQTLRQALLRLGNAELSLGRIDEALAAYEKVLAFDPANATANYQIAYIYQARGEYEKALYYYASALRTFRRRSDRRDTLLNMGNCFVRLGQYDAAYDAYQRALKVMPADPVVRRNLATLERMVRTGARGAKPLKKP